MNFVFYFCKIFTSIVNDQRYIITVYIRTNIVILVFLFHGSTENSIHMKIFYSAMKCDSYCLITCSDVKTSPPLLVISTTFLSMYW